MLTTITDILSNANDDKKSSIPPTLLYNEGWMLRLVKNWFKNNPTVKHKLSIPEDCFWYSEALLPSPFLYSPPNLKLSEGYTHADGVVGKFDIGVANKGELTLKSDCDFFYVAEAKMYSSLSAGTTNAREYNQAARNIACIADVIVRGNLTSVDFKKLGFYVLLPENHPDMANTKSIMETQNIIDSINKRISSYPIDFDNKSKSISWLKNNVTDFVSNKIDIDIITWEGIVDFINDPQLKEFYINCKNFNKK